MSEEKKTDKKPFDENRVCPCVYLETPCHEGCTCVDMFSSKGCANCCTYGSLEQRKEKAKALTDKKYSEGDVKEFIQIEKQGFEIIPMENNFTSKDGQALLLLSSRDYNNYIKSLNKQ